MGSSVNENAPNNKVIKDRTFMIKVKYNQNQSLQGSVQWIEKGKVVHFRSMMELISLLSESVENKEIRSWEGDDGRLSLVQL
jgi:hypothetical protein